MVIGVNCESIMLLLTISVACAYCAVFCILTLIFKLLVVVHCRRYLLEKSAVICAGKFKGSSKVTTLPY